MSEPKLFTWWMHDNRPLSEWLETHVLRRVSDELSDTKSVEEVDAFLTNLSSIVDRIRPAALEAHSFGEYFEGDGGWRPGRRPGESIKQSRWLFPVEMSGDLEQLVCWPDKVAVGVKPVGPRSGEEPTNEERRQMTTPAPSADDVSPLFAQMTSDTFLYTPAYIPRPGHKPALYFTFDVTPEDIDVFVDTPAFATAASARLNYLREMCSATNAQVEAFVAGELVDRVADAAKARRDGFSKVERIRTSLSFEPGWSAPAPRLAVPAAEHGEGEAIGDIERQDLSAADVVDLAPEGGERLSKATFYDVQRVIGAWASGVHAYPRSFTKLTEDDLSCLLASTLNATLPGADREVYRYNGKTDIVVRAEALPGGRSSEPVFVCEAKKLGKSAGPAVASKALETQLLTRYTNAFDTSTVLLLYMSQSEFHGPRDRTLEAIRTVEGYQPAPAEDEQGAVEDWPVLTFLRGERTIRVCIAFVHLPAD
ncbi:hypothetical protein ABIE44_003026 [Marmoricola sp. OAE513]|uniref:hypothetical protein n=1 Tax=Marmoricola sp. OAE513 TaxID=2817894 RepID=UPI001AE291E7